MAELTAREVAEILAKNPNVNFLVGLSKAPSPEELKATISRFLRGAKWVAALTSTDIDNKVIAVVENLIEEEWFLEILAFVLSFTGTTTQLKDALDNR